jgi:cytochrome oxidase Cu insertion factor (SCO1/SenC/PrrC family)
MSVVFLMLLVLSAALPITEAVLVSAQARPKPQQQAARYTCPMHREVSSAKPGRCPKCGMALRLVTDAGDNSASEKSATTSIPSARIPDVKVYDQNGNAKNFYTDLVKGKTVAINFIFTTCTTICPPLTATFRRVQQGLAERALDVQLISVSVDPATDTSERLRDFAAKFKAGPGWTFVTGERAAIDSLLQALGAAVADKNDHTPLVLIGNDVSGYWTRADGLSSPASLLKVITEAAGRK